MTMTRTRRARATEMTAAERRKVAARMPALFAELGFLAVDPDDRTTSYQYRHDGGAVGCPVLASFHDDGLNPWIACRIETTTRERTAELVRRGRCSASGKFNMHVGRMTADQFCIHARMHLLEALAP